jgi:Flp pilus assembly protein TadG
MNRLLRLNESRGRGQALVEFALIIPIFVLVLVGILDLGRGAFALNTVSNTAREAVRVGIVDQDCNSIINEARKQGATLALSAGDITVRLWNPSEAAITDGSAFTQSHQLAQSKPCANGGAVPTECVPPLPDTGVAVGCIVEVTVSYQYSAATPILGNIVGKFSITSTSRQPTERNCQTYTLVAPATCQQP